MSHRLLKEWLDNHTELTDEQAIAAINDLAIAVNERLTKAELAIFLSRHPRVRARLKQLADATPNPNTATEQEMAIWGLATSALELLEIPGVEFSVFEIAKPAIDALLAAQILDTAQHAELMGLITDRVSLASQWFGNGYVVSPADLVFARNL